jgi:hypothetical protein
MNLGYLYRTFSQIEEKEENSQRAVGAYSEALNVFSSDNYPEIFADLQK